MATPVRESVNGAGSGEGRMTGVHRVVGAAVLVVFSAAGAVMFKRHDVLETWPWWLVAVTFFGFILGIGVASCLVFEPRVKAGDPAC